MTEITGKVVQVLPVQTGTSPKGQWKKQTFILEQPEYAKKACIELFGDKLDKYKVAVGEQVKVAINIQSREFLGKWYTNVEAWKVEKTTGTELSSDLDTSNDLPF